MRNPRTIDAMLVHTPGWMETGSRSPRFSKHPELCQLTQQRLRHLIVESGQEQDHSRTKVNERTLQGGELGATPCGTSNIGAREGRRKLRADRYRAGAFERISGWFLGISEELKSLAKKMKD